MVETRHLHLDECRVLRTSFDVDADAAQALLPPGYAIRGTATGASLVVDVDACGKGLVIRTRTELDGRQRNVTNVTEPLGATSVVTMALAIEAPANACLVTTGNVYYRLATWIQGEPAYAALDSYTLGQRRAAVATTEQGPTLAVRIDATNETVELTALTTADGLLPTLDAHVGGLPTDPSLAWVGRGASALVYSSTPVTMRVDGTAADALQTGRPFLTGLARHANATAVAIDLWPPLVVSA